MSLEVLLKLLKLIQEPLILQRRRSTEVAPGLPAASCHIPTPTILHHVILKPKPASPTIACSPSLPPTGARTIKIICHLRIVKGYLFVEEGWELEGAIGGFCYNSF